MSNDRFLSGVRALVVEQGLGKARASILCKQLVARGGETLSALSPSATHLLVGKNVRRSRLPALLGGAEVGSGVSVVRADWLSQCLCRGEMVEEREYEVPLESFTSPCKTESSPASTTSSPSKIESSPATTISTPNISSTSKTGNSPATTISTPNISSTSKTESSPATTISSSPSKTESSPATRSPIKAGRISSPNKKSSPSKSLCSPAATSSASTTERPSTAVGSSGENSSGFEEATTTEGETTGEEGEENTEYIPDRFPTSSRRWQQQSGGKKSKQPSPDPDSDYVDSAGEEEEEGGRELAEVDISAVPPRAKRKRRWICEVPQSEVQSWVNHNKHITDKLEELLAVYQSNRDDKWRALSTTKVIQAIKKHPKEITSYEDALSVPFVGKRLALKIEEIVVSGRLRRLEAVDKEKQAVLAAFAKIHGVGQVLAEQFYTQGYRSVGELSASGLLNRQQRIGVKHYEDFQERMPREEVSEIEERVRELAHQVNQGLEVVTCGSYRRGKPTCGDVDVLVTHSDGRSHRGVLPQLIQLGRESGFLTDDLSTHHDQSGGGKYLGVCRLPGTERKYRRIDIYVTPYSEFPLMLLHFTGSGYFNRSMRSKADKLGMSLSEHSLNSGVIRKNGVKVFEGMPLPVFSERDVFKYLDIPYSEPTGRDWD